MTQEQLERLLNTACEIIIELEHNADEEQRIKIEALFQEIKYSDELYTEEQLHNDLVWNDKGIGKHPADADMEAQDFDTFGTNKI